MILPEKLAIERVIQRQTNNPNAINAMDDSKMVVTRMYEKLNNNYPSVLAGFDELVEYFPVNNKFIENKKMVIKGKNQ